MWYHKYGTAEVKYPSCLQEIEMERKKDTRLSNELDFVAKSHEPFVVSENKTPKKTMAICPSCFHMYDPESDGCDVCGVSL